MQLQLTTLTFNLERSYISNLRLLAVHEYRNDVATVYVVEMPGCPPVYVLRAPWYYLHCTEPSEVYKQIDSGELAEYSRDSLTHIAGYYEESAEDR